LNDGVFPNDKISGNPLSQDDVLPYNQRLDAGSLPGLEGVTKQEFDRFTDALRAEQVAAEDRLSYVAVSRAKTTLLASASYWWPERRTASQPSRLFETIVAQAQVVELAPPAGVENPLDSLALSVRWPVALDGDAQERLNMVAAAVLTPSDGQRTSASLSPEDARRLERWQVAADQLAAQDTTVVAVPDSVSASALMTAHRDAAEFFAAVARPMPRLVDAGAARGTLFHDWVAQRFRQVGAFFDDDPTDLGWPTPDAISDLVAAFESGPYAWRVPIAVETPFVAVIAGQQVRGRIDAVYAATGAHRYQIVDWKTSAHQVADDMQLTLYRLAWAQMMGCPLAEIDSVFYYVAQNRLVRPKVVPAAQIEEWVAALRQAGGVASNNWVTP